MGEILQPIDNVYQEMQINDVLKNRKIHINEDVNEISMFKVRYYMEKIKRLDDINKVPYGNRKPIEIVVNSYGGSVYEMLGTLGVIDEFINKYKYEIITTCTGKAMSCGALLLMSGSKRRTYKYSTILIHKLSSGMWGNYDQLECGFNENKRLQDLLENYIISKTNISKTKLRNKTKGVDWSLSPEECLKLGIVDEII